MMEEKDLVVYMNGEFVPKDQAKISVFDLGFTRSDCVYDTTSAWNGYVFKLDQHLERFYRSAYAIKLKVPLARDELKGVVLETTRRCGLRDAYIQLICTRGQGPPSQRDFRLYDPTLIVYARPYIWIARPDVQKRGIRAMIANTRRTPVQCLDPKIKNFNWLGLVLAYLEALEGGYENAIMLDINGAVTEGPGFNVFAVIGGTLYTPAEGVLMGITRQTVFEIAEQEGVRCAEGVMTPYDLYTAEEVFFSSTAGGVMPVVGIDGRPIGEGKPGPVTLRIKEAYWKWREEGVYGTPIYDR
jgi:branched-chain amino acid aminotransferase